MTRCRHCLNRHPQLFLTSIVLLIWLLIGCGASQTKGTTTATPIPVDRQASHIIIQLFRSPGFIYPPINGVPEWTLYGNRTLLLKSATGDLVQAQLSFAEVQHILDVVVNQNAFFASTQTFYGRMIPDSGSFLLSVSANGQGKEIRLFGEPASSSDQQTQHVFAIEHFLLDYHPTTTQPYIPPGVVLLALAQQGESANAPSWPYDNIALAQVAVQECPFLQFGNTQPCGLNTASKSGLFPIYGKQGLQLWQQWQSDLYRLVSQSGKNYQIIVWPLLPDALSPRANGSQGVRVEGEGAGLWPLLNGLSNRSY